MMGVYSFQSGLFLLIAVVLLVVKTFALLTAVQFSGEAYEAGGKLTKPAWLMILGFAAVIQLLFLRSSPLSLLNLAGTIAAFVYLADVRPALLEITGRRR